MKNSFFRGAWKPEEPTLHEKSCVVPIDTLRKLLGGVKCPDCGYRLKIRKIEERGISLIVYFEECKGGKCVPRKWSSFSDCEEGNLQNVIACLVKAICGSNPIQCDRFCEHLGIGKIVDEMYCYSRDGGGRVRVSLMKVFRYCAGQLVDEHRLVVRKYFLSLMYATILLDTQFKTPQKVKFSCSSLWKFLYFLSFVLLVLVVVLVRLFLRLFVLVPLFYVCFI